MNCYYIRVKLIEAYKHCPRCGGILERTRDHLTCSKCGKDLYLNPKPCTCIILRNNSRECLLVERGVEPKKGYWDLPGGFVDEGEDFEESTRREVKEELGVELKDLQYVGTFIEPYEFQGADYNTATVCYEGDLPENAELEPADDVASFQFFSIDKLPYDKFAFPGMKKMFKKI